MQRTFRFSFLFLMLLFWFSYLRCRSCNYRTSSSTLVEFFQLLNIFSYGTFLFNYRRFLYLRFILWNYFYWFLDYYLDLFLNYDFHWFFNNNLDWFFNYDFYRLLNVHFLYNLNRFIFGQYSLSFSCFLFNL